MKKLLFASFGALMIAFIAYGCDQDSNVFPPSLNAAEEADLKFLREEEKLARDVYLYAYDKYKLMVFANISSSEQKHMDRTLDLFNTYNLVDIASAERGEFSNTDLQELYNTLVSKVDISLNNALEVGATIEDLDINDIDNMIANTTKTDILNVYEMLTCGSRNHLRAYTDQLNMRGLSYTPQYLSQAEYQEILEGQHENCGQ